MLHLIKEEHYHEYKIRFIGALIAFPIPLNSLEFEKDALTITMLFVLGFPIWGIGFNLMVYLATNFIEGFFQKLSREQIYRCLVLGHIPMFLAVFSIPAFELISFQKAYLLTLWSISVIFSGYLIRKIISSIS